MDMASVEELQKLAARMISLEQGRQLDDDDAAQADDPAAEDPGDFDLEELQFHLTESVKKAKAAGMSKKGAAHLTNLVARYENIFRVRISGDPPVNVAPMRTELNLMPFPIAADRGPTTRSRNSS